MSKKKYVYLFSEGNAQMRELLGGKGANLAEMTGLGLPVPPGFTVTTEACTQYYEDGKWINEDIVAEIFEYLGKLEKITGKKFGDSENPLLVSVRSGARASMPGMMDTILNLGLNEQVVEVIAKKSNNPRWAWDCYRRFIQMYSDVVMEVGKKYFEQLIDKLKAERGVTMDTELTADDLKTLAHQFKSEYKKKIGKDFPDDPKDQLLYAIKAVFRSWDNPRANVYRRDNDIPYSWGTAVNVQMMAFGNMGDDCGTGVAFTRNPATGEKKLFGEFLTNAQGEDVVAGVRTPMPISEMAEKFPKAFAQFEDVCNILEKHYRDMQDMEFTIEELAEKLGLPAEALAKTVERNNQNYDNQRDDDFGKEPFRLSPVRKPPFFGVRTTGALLCTMDGIVINTQGQALREDGSAIEGLYVTGNDSGGYYSMTYPNLSTGNACGRTVTFARMIAQNLAAQ